MRVWDISPKKLCANHLLGEHVEMHAIWNIITGNKKGYAKHPETQRWRGKLKALFLKHAEVAAEMQRRGYHHQSELDPALATGRERQGALIDSVQEQKRLIKRKGCACRI